ncbi:MAG TPA: hypothetical protein VFJ16_00140 [Longimicrobium sp.]|nr:hypothetical protein [Longimicrobium sp.]
MKLVFRTAALPLLCAAPLMAQSQGGAAAQTSAAPPAAPASAPARLPAPAAVVVTRAPGTLPPVRAGAPDGCTIRDITRLGRNPTPVELRCRYGARGPGRFGLLSYLDVPVYQPVTPQPGTHVVGVPGMPHPALGESYEQWEWRVLRTLYGAQANSVHREMELLDPIFATRLMRFEHDLAVRGVHARRRETWRSPERQAYIFQQGRSRPGHVATTTLTSWHNRVDRNGRPPAAPRTTTCLRATSPFSTRSRRRWGWRATGPIPMTPATSSSPTWTPPRGWRLPCCACCRASPT